MTVVDRQEVLFEELGRQKEALTALEIRLDKIEDELVRICDALCIRRPRPEKIA